MKSFQDISDYHWINNLQNFIIIFVEFVISHTVFSSIFRQTSLLIRKNHERFKCAHLKFTSILESLKSAFISYFFLTDWQINCFSLNQTILKLHKHLKFTIEKSDFFFFDILSRISFSLSNILIFKIFISFVFWFFRNSSWKKFQQFFI